MANFRYTLDQNGFVVACGYGSYENTVSVDDPFFEFEIIYWRKNIVTGEWIFLPDVTPVDRTINRVEYDWKENTVSIYLNDIYRTEPYIFTTIQNMSEQDCIDLINKYTDDQLKNYDL